MRTPAALMLLLVVAAADASAAALWGPTWSEITGSRWSRVTMNRAPAIIESVDGRSYTDRVVKIEPGPRRIVVQSPRRKGFLGSDSTLEIDVRPCVRYYINAQFASSVGPEWQPVIAQEQPIAGCKVPR